LKFVRKTISDSLVATGKAQSLLKKQVECRKILLVRKGLE